MSHPRQGVCLVSQCLLAAQACISNVIYYSVDACPSCLSDEAGLFFKVLFCQACRHRTDCFIYPINLDDQQHVMRQVELCRWVGRFKKAWRNNEYLSAAQRLCASLSKKPSHSCDLGPHRVLLVHPAIDKDHCPTLRANRLSSAGRQEEDGHLRGLGGERGCRLWWYWWLRLDFEKEIQ